MTQPGYTVEIPPSTVELLVLKTLEVGGAMQVFGIARFIHATSEEVLRVETAMLYRALHRLAARGLVAADGTHRARCYSITPEGRRALPGAITGFDAASAAVRRILQAGARPAAPALVE